MFTHTDALVVLLTVEALLLAALSLALSLTGQEKLVRDLPVGPFWIALFSTVALWVVALGAGAAWWAIFAKGWPPSSVVRTLESVGIAAGILVEPLVASVLTKGTKFKD